MTLTKKDVETLKGIFVTKDEFHFGFESLQNQIQHVQQGQDKLIKMFEIRQQEDLMAMNSERDRDRKIENHERRIVNLEANSR